MKQVYLRMSARHKVMHIKWSHLKSFLWNQGRSRWIHEIDLNVYLPLVQIIVWLGLAWEGEDSKERASKDQARVNDKRLLRCWWTTIVVKKRYMHWVLALIKLWEVTLWGESNHSSKIYTKKWLDVIKWTHMVGNGLSHMLKVDLVKKNETKAVATLVKTYCEKNGIWRVM